MRRRIKRRFAGWFLGVWVFLLLLLTLIFRESSSPYALWIPFTSLKGMYRDSGLLTVIYQVGGNIAWFIPIGFLLPYIARIKPWQSVLCGMALSIFIEGCQYLFDLGCTDIDDLIFNTLGTLIGALLFYFYQTKMAE